MHHKIVKKIQGQTVERKLNLDTSSVVDEKERKVSFILISKNNDGERFDWWKEEVYIERLDVNGATYERLKTFFKDHVATVDSAIGRVENIRVESGELKADVIFGTDAESEKINSGLRIGDNSLFNRLISLMEQNLHLLSLYQSPVVEEL